MCIVSCYGGKKLIIADVKSENMHKGTNLVQTN